MGSKDSVMAPQPGPRKVWPWLLVVIILVVVLAGSVSLFRTEKPYVFNGLQFDPVEPAPNFALIDQHHSPVRLSDYRGQVVVLYFGFLNCPDECPLTMATWKQVANILAEDTEHVRFVMVTVDPERDTPEKMREYLAIFNPDFVGLSGSLEDIEDVALPYNVYFKRLELEEEGVMSAHLAGDEHGHGDGHTHKEANYLVAHTTLTFVIDQTGQLVLAYPLGTRAQEIATDLRYLLK